MPSIFDIIGSLLYNSTMNESVDNDPSHLLFKQLSSMVQWASSRLDATLSRRRLSGAKLSVLRALCQASEPLPLGKLAARLACGKSNVTQLVDRLEHDGFVRRVPRPDDRRCVCAVITDEGRRRCEWGVQTKSAVVRQWFGNLSERKKKQLAALLAEIHLDTD